MSIKKGKHAVCLGLAALCLCTGSAAAAIAFGGKPYSVTHAAGDFFTESASYDISDIGSWYGVPVAQGENGFYALYGKAESEYFEMTTSQTDGNAWRGGAQYNNIDWRQDFSPDGGNDAILAWRAPYNGKVKFQGKVEKSSFEGSDGITLKAIRRASLSDYAEEIYHTEYTQPFTVYFSGEELTVASGEIYYFAIDQRGNSANDGAKLFVKAEFTQNAADPGEPASGGILPSPDPEPSKCIFNRYPDYALEGKEAYYAAPVTQGDNNLWALYGKADGFYAEMTAGTQGGGNHWQGSAANNNMWWRQEFAPDGGDDVILAWRAPFNGKVKFTGKVFKNFYRSESDGIVLKAYHRQHKNAPATELYNVTADKGYFVAYFNGAEISVQSGEIYYFAIGQNKTPAYDMTNVWLKAEFTKDESNAGEEAIGGIIPDYAGDPSCIFNETQGYPMGQESEYYAVPVAQGDNGFFALYGKANGFYAEMTTSQTDGNAWKGGAQYNNIDWRQDFSPDGGNDAIIAWRAPFNGKVKFTGKVFKTSFDGSDGIVLKAYNRKSLSVSAEEIYNKTFTQNFAVYFNGVEIPVQSGEIYYFAIGQNGHSVNDVAKVWLKAQFTKDESNAGEEASGGIIPDYAGDPSCIFNDAPSYPLGDESEYYAVPIEQGGGNFWILYGKADGRYYEMTTSQTDGNAWKGGAEYNEVNWRQDFGPAGGNDAIIAWRAPFNGTVKFTGKVFKDSFNGSDGIALKAYNRKSLSVSAEEIYNKTFTQNFAVYFNGAEYEVVSGELYYFAIDQAGNSAFDQTKIWLKAEFTKNEQNAGEEASGGVGCARPIDYTGYYGTEQGANGWFYAQGSIEKYALMEFGVNKNSGKLVWNGIGDWHLISADNVSPGTKYGSLRIYVCAQDGIISVEGALVKTGEGGDGMNAKIYHNQTELFSYAFGSACAAAELPQSMKNIRVKKGDTIAYYTDCGGNGSNAYDNVTFACEIFVESAEGDRAENLISYLSPVNKLELQGIALPPPELDENEDYPEQQSGSNAGLIIGLSAGGGVLAVAAAVAAALVFKKKKRAIDSEQSEKEKEE